MFRTLFFLRKKVHVNKFTKNFENSCYIFSETENTLESVQLKNHVAQWFSKEDHSTTWGDRGEGWCQRPRN